MVWLTLGLAFGVALVVGWLSLRLGSRIGLVDLPDDDLKTHTGAPVPLGGLAVLAALHLAMTVADAFDPGLFAASVALFVVGLVDDLFGLAPILRLVGTAAAGLLFALLSDTVVGPWPSVAAVFLVVLLVNAINLIDGLDALAGSVSLVAAAGLAVLGATLGLEDAYLPLILSAALLGFLVWNRPPARLYLGDNGAYVVGLVLAWAILYVSSDWTVGLLGVGVVGVPLIDLGATVVRRISRGSALFAGDRDHSYDRLHRAGLSVGRVSMTYAIGQTIWVALLIGAAVLTNEIVAVVVAAVVGLVAAIRVGLSR